MIFFVYFLMHFILQFSFILKKTKNKTILCNSKIVLFLVLLFSEK